LIDLYKPLVLPVVHDLKRVGTKRAFFYSRPLAAIKSHRLCRRLFIFPGPGKTESNPIEKAFL